jgi:hypothetical protein
MTEGTLRHGLAAAEGLEAGSKFPEGADTLRCDDRTF